jgi:hypothetical protein
MKVRGKNDPAAARTLRDGAPVSHYSLTVQL